MPDNKGRYFDDRLRGDEFISGGDPRFIAPVSIPALTDVQGVGTSEPRQQTLFPGTDADRKAIPVWDGVIMYFPRAIREIAKVSKAGNDQHNPGQKLHWAKHKSTDQANTAFRHRMDHGVGNYYDTDGVLHLAKTCWRDLAELELFLEQQERTNG